MNNLHILHLEDNPTDSELIKAILLDEGLQIEITLVDDRADYERVLGEQNFDLILADYTLPSFDGLAALKTAKEQHPLIPFILVSGTLGEEVAIESLKTGATDYVLKTNLARLVPAIKRALREKEERERRYELEKRLQHSQKMEVIGTLAGGVAHDFNNILTAILGYSELALEDVQDNVKLTSYLQSVLKAGNRAKELVQQILSAGKKDETETRPIILQPVLKEVTKLLRASLPATIRIKQEISPDCGPVQGDPTQMHQVIMNLCTNSFHAMQENGGILGTRLLPTEVSEEDDLAVRLGLASGKYLLLAVSDTGHGMTQETVDKMFDPYFTTKEPDEGTGLGLSVVHGIVESMGGRIVAESNIGMGTEIRVYLPMEATACVEEIKNEPIEVLTSGSERILVVDDEADLALLLQDMLTRMGYRVSMFTTPQSVLSVIENDLESVDLIITDLAMPGMSGTELAEKILQINPKLPIILYSGFSDSINKKKAEGLGIREYIQKPITQNKLAKAVRKALDDR